MPKNAEDKPRVSEKYKLKVLEALQTQENRANRWLSANEVAAVMGVSSSNHLHMALWALAADGFLMMRDRDGDDSPLEYAIKKGLRSQ